MDLKEYLESLKAGEEYVKVEEVGTINIEDIKDVEEVEFSFTNDDGEERKVKRVLATIEGVEKRVIIPISVMKDLKQLMQEHGDKMYAFKVLKHGEGRGTRYSVVPFLRA